jgi:hypothetical protein
MAFDLPPALQSLDGQNWAVLAAGGLVAFLVLVVGNSVFGRRRPRLVRDPGPQLAYGFGLTTAPPVRDPFVRGGFLERREAPRRVGSVIAVAIFDGHGKGVPVPGQVVNRSVTGLCLAVDGPVQVGTVLTVRPAGAPPGAEVRVQVRHCRPERDRYELGCRFVQTPSFSTQMYFG